MITVSVRAITSRVGFAVFLSKQRFLWWSTEEEWSIQFPVTERRVTANTWSSSDLQFTVRDNMMTHQCTTETCVVRVCGLRECSRGLKNRYQKKLLQPDGCFNHPSTSNWITQHLWAPLVENKRLFFFPGCGPKCDLRLPHGVEQSPVILQPQQLVGCSHIMRDGFLPVEEEGVRSPDVTGQEVVQGEHLHRAFEAKSLILPALTEEHVDGVFLRRKERN